MIHWPIDLDHHQLALRLTMVNVPGQEKGANVTHDHLVDCLIKAQQRTPGVPISSKVVPGELSKGSIDNNS